MTGIFLIFASLEMKADFLTGLYSEHPLVKEAAIYLAGNQAGKLFFKGLTGSAGSLVAASLSGHIPSVYLVILPEKEQAAYFYNDLTSLLGDSDVLFFPSSFRRSVLYGQADQANIVLRTGVIDYLSEQNRKGIIVSYPEALMEKVVSRKILSDNTFIINRGDRLSMGFLTELLEEYDFNLVDFVSEPGQYAIRGSIVDVFSFSSGMPFRIDFSGDEIDSLRSFDPDRQLSVEVHEQVRLVPDLSGASRISVSETFISLLPPGSVLWIEDGEIILQKINSIREQALQKKPSDVAVDIDELVITGSKLLEETSPFRVIETGSMPVVTAPVIFEFNTEPQPAFAKNFGLLAEKMRANYDAGYETLIVSESESQIQRLSEIFAEIGPDLKYNSVIAGLHGGFTDHLLKTAIYTDHQIFDRYHKFSIKGYFTRKESITLKELTGLNPGDYVVHIDHGIGRFGGLEKIEVNGKIQEAIRLVYKDNDILYVPIHSLHRISKYKSGENAAPRINKLGSGAWQKLKESTKRKVKDIAKDLITLYASRLSAPGYSFSQDSYLQRELEASFIYEDTPDQLKTTNEVKKDMESPHPMDRLVCGDVGFGKTEIAIRAAFKAAADSKQTALLVPTTVLAYQHFRTFTERLKNFPCTVEYLTRHKKISDQKKILEKLEKGQIDIIIGTHKLISDNVRFRDLGLLIIDEEQRFGVAAKEKLKKLKNSVDTLTLTATPIPRTLQFSLMGARDLSVINTPPPNRMPIITELHGFNEDIIKDGIEYEVSRNGQVFFIHNRIDTIYEIEKLLKRLCPQVKTAVIHGKMEGRDIEETMLDFIRGDYDILVSTTIIESGLDIPNANTIFINDAHHFGLSELHQLRGRVGRSNRKAFCYLLSPPLSSLTPEARRRLKAIEDFSELGSGFNIALQDIDIRGSGNLLGSEQSGFIADIGYDTYYRILKEAMEELRLESDTKTTGLQTESKGPETKVSFVTDVQVDTDFEIMFPDEYISNISERLRLYKELNEIESEEELAVFEQSLADRFGPLPQPARSLLDIVKLKWLAARAGIEKIILRQGIMMAYFVSSPDSAFYRSEVFAKVMGFLNSLKGEVKVKQKDTRLSFTVAGVKSLPEAMELMRRLTMN